MVFYRSCLQVHRRYDLWNVRLRFAALEAPRGGKGPWRYTLWSPTHSGEALEEDGPGHSRVYRGPVAPDWLQPCVVAGATEGKWCETERMLRWEIGDIAL